MGKNAGGNKQKSKKNNGPRKISVPISMITPNGTSTFLAQVTKSLGNYRILVETQQTKNEYNALIPGSFRNKIWINTNDYVLIQVSTELGGNNCFVIHKYESDELAALSNLGLFITKTILSDFNDNIIFGDIKDDKKNISIIENEILCETIDFDISDI